MVFGNHRLYLFSCQGPSSSTLGNQSNVDRQGKKMKNYLAVIAICSGLLFSSGTATFAASTTDSVVLEQAYPLSEFPGCEVTFSLVSGSVKAILSGTNATAYSPNMLNLNFTPTYSRMNLGTCGSTNVYAVTMSGINDGSTVEFTIDIGKTATSTLVDGQWPYTVQDPKDTFTTDLPLAPAATAPSGPSGLTVTSHSTSSDNSIATIAFSAPADDGGAEITDYEYQLNGGDWTSNTDPTTSSPVYIYGLQASTEYTVSIRAVNSIGAGTASDTVTFTTSDVVSAPSTPTVSVEVGDGSATVTYVVESNGGSDLNIAHYQLNGGDWLDVGDTSGTIALDNLENGTEYSISVRVGNLFFTSDPSAAVTFTPGSSVDSSAVSSGGSSNGSTSAAEVATAQIIQSDIMRTTRSSITANNSMMLKGLTRFMSDRMSGVRLAEAISTSGVSGFVVSQEIKVSEDAVFGSGSFAGESVSADGIYRRIIFGDFDLQHEMGAGDTFSFNGRMAWERAAGDDAMIAYFLGTEVNRSNIEGEYSGSQNRYGLTGGVYGIKALENNIFLAGFGSLGAARSSLDISDSAGSDVTGDFTSRTLSLGGQLNGHAKYEGFEIRPMLTVDVAKTWVGDITMDESGTAMDVAVGDTTFVQLIATPEFILPLDQLAETKMVTFASVAPRVICESTFAADTISRDCGVGLELGVNSVSEDGATSLNSGIRFDRVGSVDRLGLNLQAEFRF